MGRARLGVASAVIGALLFLEAPACSCRADQSLLPRIRIRICDQAGLSKETLTEARRMASIVFREAAIELLWMNNERSSVADADCILRIHCCFDKMNTGLHRRTLGLTPAGGRHITVFWDRVKIEAASVGISDGILLGCVMAHELGHLLLPPGYHSAYGIMQKRLRFDDWSRMRGVGSLFFSRTEADLMRAALAGTSR